MIVFPELAGGILWLVGEDALDDDIRLAESERYRCIAEIGDGAAVEPVRRIAREEHLMVLLAHMLLIKKHELGDDVAGFVLALGQGLLTGPFPTASSNPTFSSTLSRTFAITLAMSTRLTG